jgi:hypothetical protein
MHKSEVLHAWTTILSGRAPSLSIEITQECPLRCPGCYAFDPAHLSGDTLLRQLAGFKGDELVAQILAILDECAEWPFFGDSHISIRPGREKFYIGDDDYYRYDDLSFTDPYVRIFWLTIAIQDVHRCSQPMATYGCIHAEEG